MSVAAIQIQRKKLGLSEARYRSILRSVGNAASSRDLSPEADRAVYRTLCDMARATTPQARYVWVLWEELQPYLPPAEKNGAYLADLSELSSQPPQVLHKAIEALKQRIAQEQSKVREEVPF